MCCNTIKSMITRRMIHALLNSLKVTSLSQGHQIMSDLLPCRQPPRILDCSSTSYTFPCSAASKLLLKSLRNISRKIITVITIKTNPDILMPTIVDSTSYVPEVGYKYFIDNNCSFLLNSSI